MKPNEFRAVIDLGQLPQILSVLTKILSEVNPQLLIREETLRYRSLISIQFNCTSEQAAFLERMEQEAVLLKSTAAIDKGQLTKNN